MIPAGRENEAVARYRRGEPVEAIWRWLWPSGNAAVSYSTLGTILRMSADEAREPPNDALPDEVGKTIEAVVEARDDLMEDLRAARSGEGSDPDGQAPPTVALYLALARIATVHLQASKHQIELQKHRVEMERRRGPARKRGTVQ